jgi:hypothetical protein
MKRVILSGMVLTGIGLAALGCGSSNDNSSSNGGSKGSGGSAGSGGNAKGGSGGNAGSGGSNGGTTGTAAECDSTTGSYTENTTFGTEGSAAPYEVNKWGTWGNDTVPKVGQTTTGPDGLDCSSGCATLTIDFSSGTAQYSAGVIVEYFGSASDSVMNLLNETITAKIAVSVQPADGATSSPPIVVNLFGQDATTSSSGVDNVWVYDLGGIDSLKAADGWHTVSKKVADERVPSWSPARTVCAASLHSMGIRIQNNSAIDAATAAVVTLYVQSFEVAP